MASESNKLYDKNTRARKNLIYSRYLHLNMANGTNTLSYNITRRIWWLTSIRLSVTELQMAESDVINIMLCQVHLTPNQIAISL